MPSVAADRARAAPRARERGGVRVLVIAGALLVVVHMHRAGGGVIAPELHALFGFSGAELGLIMGAMFLASAIAQLPTGLAFDRFGPRRTVSAGALIAIGGTLIFAASETLGGLMLGRFLVGAGFAGVVSTILLLAMRWAPPERFTTVAATALGLASGAGSVLATVPLARLLTGLGWTPTFLVIAAVTGLLVLLVFVLVRDAPAGHAATTSKESLKSSLGSLRRLLRDPELGRVLAMAISVIAPFMCVGGLWAGPYLRDIHGLSTTGMSTALLGMVIVFNLATLAYGPLDRLFNTRKRVVLGGAGITTAGLAGLALAPELTLWQAIVLLHVIALGAPFYVVLTAHCRALVPDALVGRAITTLNFVSLSGAFLMQWLTGLIMSGFSDGRGLGSLLGYRMVFAVVALLLIGSAAIYARTPDRPPRAG